MLSVSEITRVLNVQALNVQVDLSKDLSVKIVIDSREAGQNTCFLGIQGERFDGNDFAREAWEQGCRVFVLNRKKAKKISVNLPESLVFVVSDTVEALGNLAKAYRQLTFTQTFAVTGSAGKTTTRRMIATLLETKFHIYTARKNLNNEIGLPLTMLETPPETYVSVLELGMNHPGEIRYLASIAQPLAGLITNIGYAHIGNFGSLEAIADAKSELLAEINPRGFVFLNREDPFFEYLKAKSLVTVVEFGTDDFEVIEHRGIEGYRLKYRGIEFDFALPGEHHLEDLAAAFAVGDFYRIKAEQMTSAISHFSPIKLRSEVIRCKRWTLINDCYNANPSSMRASLGVLKYSGENRKVAVLADMLELGKSSESEHWKIGEWIAKQGAADLVLLYGKWSTLTIPSVLEDKGIEVVCFESLDKLTAGVLEQIKEGDIVLIKGSRGMCLEKVTEVLSD